MKQAAVTGVGRAGVVDVPEPSAKEDWAKVKVHIAPMCAEWKGFVKGDGGYGYGHEAVGEVVEVAQPGRVEVGDRVVVQPCMPCGACPLCVSGDYIHCQHMVDIEAFTGAREGMFTMAQYVLKPDWLLSSIPDDVSYERAALAICGLGPTFESCDRMQVGAFDTVLITGLGPVGLGGVINARFRGARVIGVDSNGYRAELARELGAETVLDPMDDATPSRISELTGGVGVDKCVDCSGIPAAHRLCIDATRRKGHVAFVGECREQSFFTASNDMIRKGLTLHGVWHYNLAAYPRVMQVIRESPVIDKLVTHTYPIGDIQQAWATQASGQCGKVLLKPWE